MVTRDSAGKVTEIEGVYLDSRITASNNLRLYIFRGTSPSLIQVNYKDSNTSLQDLHTDLENSLNRNVSKVKVRVLEELEDNKTIYEGVGPIESLRQQ